MATAETISTPATASPAERPGPADAAFVWLVWAAMLGAAFYLVARWGENTPRADDTLFADVLTGQEPATWAWLWKPHYEHTKPVANLVMLAAFRLSGGDWRGTMWFDTAALGVLAAALILAVRRARGWTAYADAYFPLVLLHWGHSENFLWTSQVGFVLTAVLSGLVLANIAHKPLPAAADVFWVVAGLVALALSGATGLAMVPPLALWAACYGFRSGWVGRIMAAVGLAALASFTAYAVNVAMAEQHESGAGHMHSNEPLAIVRAAFEFLSTAYGALRDRWRWEGWLVTGLLAVSAGLCARAWVRWPVERWRAAGVFSFVAGVVLLALAVGRGRGLFDAGSIVLSVRYSVLPLPAACVIYVAAALFTRGAVRHWVQILLLLIPLGMLWPNTANGMLQIRSMRDRPPAYQRWSQEGPGHSGQGDVIAWQTADRRP